MKPKSAYDTYGLYRKTSEIGVWLKHAQGKGERWDDAEWLKQLIRLTTAELPRKSP